jgi:hypothetical protein
MSNAPDEEYLDGNEIEDDNQLDDEIEEEIHEEVEKMERPEYTHAKGFSIKDPFASTVQSVYTFMVCCYLESHIRASDREALLRRFDFCARDRDLAKTTLRFFDIAERHGKVGPEKLDLLRSCLVEQNNKACVDAIDTFRAFVISKQPDGDVASFVRDTEGAKGLRDAREQERQRKERQVAMAKRKRERQEARREEKRKRWAKERDDAERRVASDRRCALNTLVEGAKALAPEGDSPPSGDFAYVVMKREVGEQLRSSDRATIMLLANLSVAAKENVRCASELFSAMETKGKLSSRDVRVLLTSLDKRNVPAYRLVEAYKTAYIK